MEGGGSSTEAVLLQAAGLQRRLRDAIERCPANATTRDGRREREMLVTVGVNLETLEMRIIDYHEYDGPLNEEKARVLQGIDEARNELIRKANDGIRYSTRGESLFRDILEFVGGNVEEDEADPTMPAFDVDSPIGTPLEKDKLLKGAQATRWDPKDDDLANKSSFDTSPTSVLSEEGFLEQPTGYGNGPIFKRQLFKDEDLQDERGVLGGPNRPNQQPRPQATKAEEDVVEKIEKKPSKKVSILGRIFSWIIAGGVTWAAVAVFSATDKTRRPPGLWTPKTSVPKNSVAKSSAGPQKTAPKNSEPKSKPSKSKMDIPSVAVKERKGAKITISPTAPAEPRNGTSANSKSNQLPVVESSQPSPALIGPGPGLEESTDFSVYWGRG